MPGPGPHYASDRPPGLPTAADLPPGLGLVPESEALTDDEFAATAGALFKMVRQTATATIMPDIEKPTAPANPDPGTITTKGALTWLACELRALTPPERHEYIGQVEAVVLKALEADDGKG